MVTKNSPNANPGFTFIEIVVVAAIVAILAAVAIPIYIGYQNDSRQHAVDQLAQTAAAEADGFYRKTNQDPTLADLNLFYDDAKYDVLIDGPNITVTMDGYGDKFKKTVPYR